MSNDEPQHISPSEAFNAITDAMGALVQVVCRHLPPEAAVAIERDLQRLAGVCSAEGRIASSMLLTDLAEAARPRSGAPDTTH